MMIIGFGLILLLLFGGVLIALRGGGTDLAHQVSNLLTIGGSTGRGPRQLLDERLARGEISREEYEAIRAMLDR